MSLPEIVGIFIVCVVLVTMAALLTSSVAIERLVAIGLLPRAFVNLAPLMTIIARTIAVALTALGLVLFGVSAGLLSRQWLARYGFSAGLLLVGILCLAITFRRKT
ncbi:MAG: hypothetical protein JSS69_03860 [Acidobacteria bacterium]|nr:hypothetical protein [Acidobacteriota bacterium]MBS1865030.1 hypothetical protein [Acidobacteriota bacterium]